MTFGVDRPGTREQIVSHRAFMLTWVVLCLLSCWTPCQAQTPPASCAAPYLGLTRNPVITYPITIAPVVKGTVRVEFYTLLTCKPYATYNWDALKGPYYIAVLQGTAVFARITVTAADNSLPQASRTCYFKPPGPPACLDPAPPANLKIS